MQVVVPQHRAPRPGPKMDDESIGRDVPAQAVTLRTIPSTCELSKATLADLARQGHSRTVTAGQVVFVGGDRPNAVCLVLRGHVKLVRETDDGAESIICVIQPGEIFGAAAWGEADYPTTAVALDDAVLIRWAMADFAGLLARHADFSLMVIQVLGRHIREAAMRIHDLQTAPAEQRLARVLLRLAEAAGTPTAAGIEITLPLSRQHVAELAGTTLSTASRVLSAWERQGLMYTDHQRITIGDFIQFDALARDPEIASQEARDGRAHLLTRLQTTALARGPEGR